MACGRVVDEVGADPWPVSALRALTRLRPTGSECARVGRDARVSRCPLMGQAPEVTSTRIDGLPTEVVIGVASIRADKWIA
jgi:hypothetical protein